jgi:Protein involved in formate dehydrogenase formation
MANALQPVFCSDTAGSVWAAYRKRAKRLQNSIPNPLLAKYLEVLSIQESLSSDLHGILATWHPEPQRALITCFNASALQPLLAEAHHGVADCGLTVTPLDSLKRLDDLWHQVEDFEYPADFPARLVFEVFATGISRWPHREIEAPASCCPHCGFGVLCSVLREEGMGRRRLGSCSICSNEWALPRLGCLRCSEQDPEKRPIFTFEDWPHIRVEACESCGGWLKSLELAKDAEALAMPDDVASSAINLWASGRGYESIGNHLFGL